MIAGMTMLTITAILLLVSAVSAQETPTPTPVPTPVDMVVMPMTIDGVDYAGGVSLVVSVGDVVGAALMFAVLVSMWSIYALYVWRVRR